MIEKSWKIESVVSLMRSIGCHKVSVDAKNNVNIPCPLAPYVIGHKHKQDKHPSMGILVSDYETFKVNCYACGYSSQTLEGLIQQLATYDPKFTEFVGKALAIETPDLGSALAQLSYIDNAEQGSFVEKVLPEDLLIPYKGKVHPYVFRRGVSLDTCRKWEVGWDEAEKRIFFPVRSISGALIGGIGRGVHDFIQPRYLNYWNFPKSEYLYGEKFLTSKAHCLLVEGPFDVLIASQSLQEFTVLGVMGSSLSNRQRDLILSYADDVYLCGDGDPAGEKLLTRAYKALHRYVPTYKVILPEGHDPASLGEGLLPLLSSVSLF